MHETTAKRDGREMAASIDVLCVGMASYDLIFRVDRPLTEDDKSAASSLTQSGGGPAASASIAVSGLGLASAFAGYLGTDPFGDYLLNDFVTANVNIDLLVRGPAPTSISAVFVTPSGKRSLVNYRAPEPIPAGALDVSNVCAKVILFDGHEPEISIPLLEHADAWKADTVLDAGSVHEGTRKLADRVDYLVASQKFALDFTGESNLDDALVALTRHAPSVVVTVGERGLYWYHENQSGRLPAFRVDAIDTTGAGDAFHGAFAACLAMKWDWKTTLKFSSAAAAISCTQLGGRPGLPTQQDVQSFLSEHEPLDVQA
jgi:sulfofructose kinase